MTNPSTGPDCPAYAGDFAAGGPRIDIEAQMIRKVRDSPGEPTRWRR